MESPPLPPPPSPPPSRKMRGQFYCTLGDLKFLPTSGGLSKMLFLKFFSHFEGGQQSFFLLGGRGSPSSTSRKSTYYPPPRKFPPSRLVSPYDLRKTSFLAVLIAPVPFFLTLYSLCTQVMLILILIYVQHLQNVVFSFESGSSG